MGVVVYTMTGEMYKPFTYVLYA